MKLLKNYFYQFFYQFLNLLVPLITLPYITKTLGAENYGLYVYSFTIISYLILITDFGLRVYGSRKISYIRNNLSKKTNVFWEIFFTKLILTLVVLIVSIVVFFCKKLSLIYWIQLIMLVISIFDISWFYQGIEEFKEVAIRNLIIKIMYIILVFLFVKNQNNLNIYILIVIITNFIGNLILYISLNKQILKPNLKNLQLKATLKESIHLFLPEMAIKFYTSMDRIMLGYFLLKKDVSYYDIANKFLIIIMIGITTCGSVMLPKISNLFYENKFDEIKKLLGIVTDYYLMISIPLICGILATSKQLVILYLGNEYIEVIPIINIMSFTIIFWTISNITGSQILIPMKKEKILTKSVIIGSIINLILNLILIRKIGVLGVVIATFITEGVVTSIQIYYSKEYLNFNLLKLLKYLFSSIIMYIIIIIIKPLYLKIISGIIIYLLLMIILKVIDLKQIKIYIKK